MSQLICTRFKNRDESAQLQIQYNSYNRPPFQRPSPDSLEIRNQARDSRLFIENSNRSCRESLALIGWNANYFDIKFDNRM